MKRKPQDVSARIRSLPEPSTCPWCGQHRRVYVRAGYELVCRACSLEAQAIEATGADYDA